MKVEDERLLRVKEVASLIGVSRSTIYRMVEAGQFPQPIRIGPRASRWRLSEVLEWMTSRPLATADNWE